MSAVDQYKHKCLGIVQCPFDFEKTIALAYKNIPIYRLEQDIPDDETDFDGKCGDILVGGGSGESSGLRISIPEAFYLYTQEDWDKFNDYDEIYKSFWSATDAFVFGTGYIKLGWEPTRVLEVWLVKHVLSFLKDNYYEEYRDYIGIEDLEYNGSICRLPINEEDNL